MHGRIIGLESLVLPFYIAEPQHLTATHPREADPTQFRLREGVYSRICPSDSTAEGLEIFLWRGWNAR